MKVVHSFKGRKNFGRLLTEHGVAVAVEVGTDRGAFARQLLEGWGGFLWCVDPYEPYDHMPWDRTPDLMMATASLAPFVDRVRIVRAHGREFAERYRARLARVGFVYVDGDHAPAAVADDLAVWWPLLPRGGILAGHDFDPKGRHAPGVLAAVRRLANTCGLEVNLVADHDAHSFWMVKQ